MTRMIWKKLKKWPCLSEEIPDERKMKETKETNAYDELLRKVKIFIDVQWEHAIEDA